MPITKIFQCSPRERGNPLALTALLATCVMLGGCSSTLGGSINRITESKPSPEPAPASPSPETGDHYALDEDGIANPWKHDLNNPARMSQLIGLTDGDGNRLIEQRGEGVTIGIYDSEFNTNHQQLTERNVLGNTSYRKLHDYQHDEVEQTGRDHGTHVTALAAGRYGVAPDADLYLYAGYAGGNRVTTPQANAFYQQAVEDGLDVVNFSMSGINPDTHQVEAILDAGLLLVMAAGNDKDASPIAESTATARNIDPGGDGGGLGVLVGALDQDGDIAAYSNRAGDIVDEDGDYSSRVYYITAPGSSVPSAIAGPDGTDDELLGEKSGTSMATPLVTGTLALILAQWDQIEPEIATRILFETADRDFDDYRASLEDDGETRTDRYDHELSATYGHGRLDTANALSPQGEPRIASTQSLEGDSVTLTSTGMTLGAPFGDALAGEAALADGVILDKYSRDFAVDLSPLVMPHAQWSGDFDYGAALGALASRSHTEVIHNEITGKRLMVSLRGDSNPLGLAEGVRPGMESMSAELTLVGGTQLGLHQASTDLDTPWASPILPGDNLLLLSINGDGYLTGWDQASAITVTSPIVRGMNLQVTGVRADDRLLGDERAGLRQRTGQAERYQVGVFGKLRGNTLLHIDTGVILQDERVFNTTGNGAFGLGGDATTHTLSLGLRHQRGALGFFAWHEQGITGLAGYSRGVLRDFSRIHTAQSALGMDVQLGQVRSGAVYSEPLRVHRGSVALDLPTGVEDGQVTRTRTEADLSPNGHERRIEVFAETPLAGGFLQQGHIRMNAALRHQPGNLAFADAEAFVGGIYQGLF